MCLQRRQATPMQGTLSAGCAAASLSHLITHCESPVPHQHNTPSQQETAPLAHALEWVIIFVDMLCNITKAPNCTANMPIPAVATRFIKPRRTNHQCQPGVGESALGSISLDPGGRRISLKVANCLLLMWPRSSSTCHLQGRIASYKSQCKKQACKSI